MNVDLEEKEEREEREREEPQYVEYMQRTVVNKLKIILIEILFQIHLCDDVVMIIP